MKIALGADNFGFDLKEAIKSYLTAEGYQIHDMGIVSCDDPTPYYETAAKVAKLVSTQQVERGILFCGTGMGMTIIANKFPGIYASVCENTHAAKHARSINNANVLTMGGMFTTPMLAQDIVNVWLATEFTQDWDPELQAWLENSMEDIAAIEIQQFAVPK